MSWHTLTRKHNKYNVGEEVEAIGVDGEGEEDHYGHLGSLSLSTFASSREQLVEKVMLPGHFVQSPSIYVTCMMCHTGLAGPISHTLC